MKKYKSNITAGFCMQWTKSKAIQEYVSNMLDEGDYSFSFGEDYVELTNHNVRVSPKALLLGLSDKGMDATKRGMFGCGIPQSMAALLSQGAEIFIRNAGVIWEPEFEPCDQWDEDVLVINETQDVLTNTDYIVTISNLTEEDVDEVKQRCLEFQDREVLYSTDIGDLISGEEGEVFVGDIYVGQNKDFKYSYNFKPNVVPLSQDRNYVDPFELKKLTAKLISKIDDVEFVKEAIESNSYDTQYVTDTWATEKYQGDSHSAVDSLAKDFVEEHGSKLVTSDYSEHKNNLDNNVPSVYIDNSVKVKSIRESSIYQDAITDIDEVEELDPYEEVDRLKDEIINILSSKITSEQLSAIEELLDEVLEKSSNWYV